MNISPNRKKSNAFGLFNKIKIPKGGVNISQRKKEMIEILEDWRFVKKRISIKDVTTLQDRSLTKKIMQLIPEFKIYKKNKEEVLSNLVGISKPSQELKKNCSQSNLKSKLDSSK
jgi:hypothetical protein